MTAFLCILVALVVGSGIRFERCSTATMIGMYALHVVLALGLATLALWSYLS